MIIPLRVGPINFIALFIAMGGLALSFFSLQETLIERFSQPAPTTYEVCDLEKGVPLPNWNATLGAHLALYNATIWKQEKDPKSNRQIADAYYPVISRDHPALATLAALSGRYGGLDNVPKNEIPTVESFGVVVRTNRFRWTGEIPKQPMIESEGRSGVFVHTVLGFDPEIKTEFTKNFPALEAGRPGGRQLVILYEGHEPWSSEKHLWHRLGGLILLIFGALWARRDWLRHRTEASSKP